MYNQADATYVCAIDALKTFSKTAFLIDFSVVFYFLLFPLSDNLFESNVIFLYYTRLIIFNESQFLCTFHEKSAHNKILIGIINYCKKEASFFNPLKTGKVAWTLVENTPGVAYASIYPEKKLILKQANKNYCDFDERVIERFCL